MNDRVDMTIYWRLGLYFAVLNCFFGMFRWLGNFNIDNDTKFIFGPPFIDSKAKNKTTNVINTSDNIMNEKKQNSSSLFPCRMLITNRFLDSHVEVLESVARRFPLPWNQLFHANCNRESGLDETNPIQVDFALFRVQQQNDEEQKVDSFSLGWKRYFDNHLKTTLQRRRIDGRFIQYNQIVHLKDEQQQQQNDDYYGIEIEATCDGSSDFAQPWMAEANHHFCVLHGRGIQGKEISSSVLNQTCHLQPQHKNCWFLPSDYPFIPKQQQQQSNDDYKFTLCVPGKKRIRPLMTFLRHKKPPNVEIFLFGGPQKFLHDKFKQLGVHHYLKNKPPEEGERLFDFYHFQTIIAQCDAMIPIIKRNQASLHYFLGPDPREAGKLTGSMPLAIAHRLPTLMHSELADIYRNQLTTWHLEYNDSTMGFHQGLELLLKSLQACQTQDKQNCPANNTNNK